MWTNTVYGQDNKVLWKERYLLVRAPSAGDFFIQDEIEYTVLSVEIDHEIKQIRMWVRRGNDNANTGSEG